MKKMLVAVILSVITLAAILYGFSFSHEPADIALSTFAEEFEANYSREELQLEQADSLMLKKAFGLVEEDYEDVLYYHSTDMMSACEMLIVKLSSEEQQTSVKAAMEERLDSRKEAFDGYGSDQMEILNHAMIYCTGNYVCYIVAGEDRAWLQLFKKQIGV